jgi:Ribbon-helix-helix protein, copG family.
MVKDTVAAKISEPTNRELEEYAEEQGISKSEAINRLLDDALKIKNDDGQILISDGAGEAQETIGEIQAETQKIRSDIEADISKGKRNNTILGLALVYIIIQVAFELPDLVGAVVGIPIFVALIITNYIDVSYV